MMADFSGQREVVCRGGDAVRLWVTYFLMYENVAEEFGPTTADSIFFFFCFFFDLSFSPHFILFNYRKNLRMVETKATTSFLPLMFENIHPF